jgi:hypothetical protein
MPCFIYLKSEPLQHRNLTSRIPMSAPCRSATGTSPSPGALDWCKRIQSIQQEKMTPEQRQQVLQAAERHREILQCQVVSSEVQRRMQSVQVRPPSCIFAFLSPIFMPVVAVRCKQSRSFFFWFWPSLYPNRSTGHWLCPTTRPSTIRFTSSDGMRSFQRHFKSRQRSFAHDASRMQVCNPHAGGVVCCVPSALSSR